MKCLFCEKEAEPGEHVLLNALGGIKTTASACCNSCNTRLGKAVDKSLAEQLLFIRNQIGAKKGDGSPCPSLKAIPKYEDKTVHLSPGGKPSFPPQVKVNKETGRVQIIAPNKQEAIKMTEKILESMKISCDEITINREEKRTIFLLPIAHELSVGINELRSIAKMMINFICTKVNPDRIRSEAFQKIISFINEGGAPLGIIDHDYDTLFPNTEPFEAFTHRLFVFTNQESKKAIGLLELFGEIRFSAFLTDKWDGGNGGWGYLVDPINNEHKNIDLDCHCIPTIYHKPIEQNIPNFKGALDRLLSRITKYQSDQLHSDIIDRALNEHVRGKGPEITEKMIGHMSQQLADDLIRHTLRIDKREDIDVIGSLKKKRVEKNK